MTRRGASSRRISSLLAERYIRSGMTPDDARAAAQRQLGNVTLVREEIHQHERHRLGRRLWRRISATRFGRSTAVPAFRRSSSPRSRWVSAARRRSSASSQRCSWRRCRTSSPASSFASTSRSPTNPATRHYLAGVHFTSVREHAASFEEVAALNTYSETGPTWSRTAGLSGCVCCRSRATTSARFAPARLRGPGFDRRPTRPARAGSC